MPNQTIIEAKLEEARHAPGYFPGKALLDRFAPVARITGRKTAIPKPPLAADLQTLQKKSENPEMVKILNMLLDAQSLYEPEDMGEDDWEIRVFNPLVHLESSVHGEQLIEDLKEVSRDGRVCRRLATDIVHRMNHVHDILRQTDIYRHPVAVYADMRHDLQDRLYAKQDYYQLLQTQERKLTRLNQAWDALRSNADDGRMALASALLFEQIDRHIQRITELGYAQQQGVGSQFWRAHVRFELLLLFTRALDAKSPEVPGYRLAKRFIQSLTLRPLRWSEKIVVK